MERPPPLIQDMEDVRELFYPYRGRLAGVGMTAFSRIGPASFLDDYHVAALARTADLPILRKRADIFCLEEGGGGLTGGNRDSAAFLAHPETRAYLKQIPNPPCLVLYQSYPELEELAPREGWVILANPASLRLRLRGRAFFQEMAAHEGLCRIPGAIHPVEALFRRDYGDWSGDLGPEWVIQLPELAQGGGRGTFFVRSAEDYGRVRKALRGNVWRGTRITSLLIRKWIQGTPASVALCITRRGILVSGLQRQLIDLPYCPKTSESGIFCGHVWDDSPWDPAVRSSVRTEALKIGNHLASLGYRGILGIDWVIDRERGTAYSLEINPRYTGAFPMLSFLHLQRGIIPLEVFHLMEFLDIPYRVDVEDLNRRYETPLTGSHLLLFVPGEGQSVRGFRLRAGVYHAGAGEPDIRFVREGIDYADMVGKEEFIVADGPPLPESLSTASRDPFFRLCHLLFPVPVAGPSGALTPHARRVVEWVYGPDEA